MSTTSGTFRTTPGPGRGSAGSPVAASGPRATNRRGQLLSRARKSGCIQPNNHAAVRMSDQHIRRRLRGHRERVLERLDDTVWSWSCRHLSIDPMTTKSRPIVGAHTREFGDRWLNLRPCFRAVSGARFNNDDGSTDGARAHAHHGCRISREHQDRGEAGDRSSQHHGLNRQNSNRLDVRALKRALFPSFIRQLSAPKFLGEDGNTEIAEL